MPGQVRRGLCKPPSDNDGYHCFPDRQIFQKVAYPKCLGYGWWQPVRYSPPATILDVLQTHLQTAWKEIDQNHIQALFNSMPRRLEALIG